MQTATREAAHQVREAEQRAAALSREMDALKHDAAQEQVRWSAAQAKADEQQESDGKAVAEAISERDAARKELSKCKAELETLRHHVLDAEESAARREACAILIPLPRVRSARSILPLPCDMPRVRSCPAVP